MTMIGSLAPTAIALATTVSVTYRSGVWGRSRILATARWWAQSSGSWRSPTRTLLLRNIWRIARSYCHSTSRRTVGRMLVGLRRDLRIRLDRVRQRHPTRDPNIATVSRVNASVELDGTV